MFFIRKQGNYYKVKGRYVKLDYGAESPFINAMNNARSIIGNVNDLQDKIKGLDYLINLIEEDLCSDVGADYVYLKNGERIDLFFPAQAEDDTGTSITSASDDIITVDVSRVHIYTSPRNSIRIAKLINDNLPSDIIESTNYSIYYPELNLLYAADNNNHKLSIMATRGQGKVKCKKYYIERLYPYLSTNGEYWIKKHSNERLSTTDFRLPIIYSLAKWRYGLRHNIKF